MQKNEVKLHLICLEACNSERRAFERFQITFLDELINGVCYVIEKRVT